MKFNKKKVLTISGIVLGVSVDSACDRLLFPLSDFEEQCPDIRQHGHGSSGDGGQYCSGAFQGGSADQ